MTMVVITMQVMCWWFMCSLVLAVVMISMQLNLVAPLKDSLMIIENINV